MDTPTLTDKEIATGRILWNEDWLAQRIRGSVLNTERAYRGSQLLSDEELEAQWRGLSLVAQEQWRASARVVQELFYRLRHVEITGLQSVHDDLVHEPLRGCGAHGPCAKRSFIASGR